MGRMSETMNTAAHAEKPADRHAASIIPNKGDRTMRTMKPIVIMIVLFAGACAIAAMLNSCDIFTEKIPMKLAIEDITLEYTWDEVAKLTSGVSGGRFGESIAISGNNLIVGAPYESSAKGAAYIFHYDGKSWSAYPVITASNGIGGDFFGDSVDIDGDYAIVGASMRSSGTGAAYIYHWNGTSWSDEKILTATGGVAGDRFGCSVGISQGKAIIGAFQKYSGTGTAYAFYFDNSNWIPYTAILVTNSDSGNDLFGYSIGIDHDICIVGAYQNDDQATDSGAAYIFFWDGFNWGTGGSPTMANLKLTQDDPIALDQFGYSVSISGTYVIAGANVKSHAYIFEKTDNSWTRFVLQPVDVIQSDQFGNSVAISDKIAIIGALNDDDAGSDAGSVFIYTRKLNSWSSENMLLGSDINAGDNLGYAVAIDGNIAIASTYKQNTNTGAVYVYERKHITN